MRNTLYLLLTIITVAFVCTTLGPYALVVCTLGALGIYTVIYTELSHNNG